MIALAASNQKSATAFSVMSLRTPANFVASSGSPMTPVEARNTSPVAHPTACDADCAVSSVAALPFLPVKALALPELTTTARARPPDRFWRQKSTGAGRAARPGKDTGDGSRRVEDHQQDIRAVLVLDAGGGCRHAHTAHRRHVGKGFGGKRGNGTGHDQPCLAMMARPAGPQTKSRRA